MFRGRMGEQRGREVLARKLFTKVVRALQEGWKECDVPRNVSSYQKGILFRLLARKAFFSPLSLGIYFRIKLPDTMLLRGKVLVMAFGLLFVRSA